MYRYVPVYIQVRTGMDLHGATGRTETELASQTGQAQEPLADVASTSRMERELTSPVRGGSGQGPTVTWTNGQSRP